MIDQAASAPRRGMGTREFVALMAALMASNALAIDAMLPALADIGQSLDVAEENRRQLVITVYLIGFGLSQLFYGPLADRFGRKNLLVGSLLFYAAFGLVAGLATTFPLLLGARMLQGVAAGASRVLVVSIVRDLHSGSAMARIMSLVMIVFMIVPVLAPFFGQAIVSIGTWRHVFILLGVYGLVLALWSALRLTETLAPERRRPLAPRSILDAIWTTLRIRQSIGNVLVQTLAMGALFAFINSIQQIVFDTFGRPGLIGLVFACIAGPMALGSWLNSRLVVRLGSRRILLFGLCAFSALSLLHLGAAFLHPESLWGFVLLQAATMSVFGLIGANAGALAMEPLGHVAGTASSVQGLITTVGGAGIGFVIGQNFDGTTIPLLVGFTLCGLSALSVAAWANHTPRRDSRDLAEVEAQESVSRPA